MGVLNKADIKRPTLPKETVDVPELGGEVVVCGLRLSERQSLFAEVGEDGKNFAQIGQFLARVVVDAEGKAIFSADEWDDFGATQSKAVYRIFQVARRLSGLDAEIATKN